MTDRLLKNLAAVLFILTAGWVSAQSDTIVDRKIDWERGVLELHIESRLPDSDTPPPLIKYTRQQRIQREFSGYLLGALKPLTIDSFRTFADALNQSPDLLPVLDRLTKTAELINTQLSRDLKTLIMDYEVPLFPHLIEPFLYPGVTPGLAGLLSWEPSADFTGIVIYAADPLPVHGERDARGLVLQASIQPCLLPKIFDQDMNLLLSPDKMDPNILRIQGTAVYTRNLDSKELVKRAGDYPFYTTALGLFGKNNTDILLPREDVRRLLSREKNRQLLREGRIVIIH